VCEKRERERNFVNNRKVMKIKTSQLESLF